MIHKKYSIIILLLICILLSNFIFEYKAKAEAIALSAGLILFLKACYAVGVTYIGGQAVERLTKDSMDLYNEWQKFVSKQPPDKKPPTNWEKTAIATLLGLQFGDAFKRLVDSVRDFFNSLGAKEGENEYNPSSPPVDGDFVTIRFDKYELYTVTHKGYTFYIDFMLRGSEFAYVLYTFDNQPIGHFYDNYGALKVWIDEVSSKTIKISLGIGNKNILFHFYDDKPIVTNPEPNRDPIIYNFDDPFAYQFTNDPNNIKQVYPNLGNLPKGKIVQITDPSGKTTTYYKGSFNDLFNDWANSQNPSNLFGDKPFKLTETDEGIKIGDDSSELPYPNPNPNPDPQPTPTPEGLGQIIQLLKDLINWSSKIFRKIPEPKPEPSPEPQPETETLLEKLFKPDTKINLETDKLKKDRNLSLKFPFSIPWDLARVVKVFARSPSEPDLKIDINTEYLKINHTIDLKMITLPIGFFRFASTAFFIFFLASKTRDLIKW